MAMPPLKAGDQINTGSNSAAELIFTDGSITDLGPNTTFKVIEPGEEKSVYEVIKGKIHAQYLCIKQKHMLCRQLTYRSPAGIAVSIRGTEFEMEIAPEGAATITVVDGIVEVSGKNSDKVTKAEGGEKIVITEKGIEGPFTVDFGSSGRWWEGNP